MLFNKGNVHDTLQCSITIARMHFSKTTGNNQRKHKAPHSQQKYFRLVASLIGVCEDGTSYVLQSKLSRQIIVRASNPGQFLREQAGTQAGTEANTQANAPADAADKTGRRSKSVDMGNLSHFRRGRDGTSTNTSMSTSATAPLDSSGTQTTPPSAAAAAQSPVDTRHPVGAGTRPRQDQEAQIQRLNTIVHRLLVRTDVLEAEVRQLRHQQFATCGRTSPSMF